MVNDRVRGVYRVVWNRVSFLVIITHECAAQVCYYHQKLHEILYHTVNTWNEVINPILPL